MTMSSSSRRPKTLVLSVSFTMSASSSCLQTPQKIALRSHYIIQFWVCVNCYAHFFSAKQFAMQWMNERRDTSEARRSITIFSLRPEMDRPNLLPWLANTAATPFSPPFTRVDPAFGSNTSRQRKVGLLVEITICFTPPPIKEWVAEERCTTHEEWWQVPIFRKLTRNCPIVSGL